MKAWSARAAVRRLGLLCAVLLVSACVKGPVSESPYSTAGLDQGRHSMALLEAKEKQTRGQRVWCVPFARTASGIDISGDARTWWKAAAGSYDRGQKPRSGAVMAFASTKGMSRGHVAVVNEVVSSREITINHANWVRNKVQLDMKVVDISAANDWSKVKVERVKGEMGTSSYPVNGFIYPN